MRETMPLAGTPYVEMPAVMAKYNPFGEKAGMKRIAEQPPPKEALAIAEILQRLGFNIQLLGSEKYVLNKLQTLSEEDLEKLREAFIKHCHARFILSLFSRDAFRLFLHQLPCKFGIDIGMLVVNRKKLINSFFVA